jgi:hypothetical protein
MVRMAESMSNVYPPHYAYPSSPPVERVLPKPPGLHWGWVLALNVVTLGFFGMIWMLVQAIWVKRYAGRSVAFWWALSYLLFIPVVFLTALALGVAFTLLHLTGLNEVVAALQAIVRLGMIVVYFVTVFTLKGELQREPIGMSLSGLMTFFFGTTYLQYHIYDWDNPYGTGAGTLNLSQPVGLGLSGAVAPLQIEEGALPPPSV